MIPAPRIVGYSLTARNLVRRVFFLKPFGEPASAVDEEIKAKVYRQVSSLMIQMARFPLQPRIGLLQTTGNPETYIIDNSECAWVTSFIQGLYKVLFIRCLRGNVHVIIHSYPSWLPFNRQNVSACRPD
jgi:hypothetical protein